MATSSVYDAQQTILAILNDDTKLEDPYETRTGETRGNWWGVGRPELNYKFPWGRVVKVDNPIEIITIGTSSDSTGYEWEQAILNLMFYSKAGIKFPYGATTLQDEKFVEYYMSRIKQTLKANQSSLSPYDGFRAGNTSNIAFDPVTKCYVGAITVRIWWFNTSI